LTFADGLQVSGQVFQEIKYYENTYEPLSIDLFDGVLGLAFEKPWLSAFRNPSNFLPSPFRSMIDQSVLDVNMFSIVWPAAAREQGSIMFGGYDEDLLDGELVSHALFPENIARWQVEVERLSLINSTGHNGREVVINQSISNGKAFFMSFPPSMAFPWDFANSLHEHIGSTPSACVRYRNVDCDRVHSLPEIVIGLKGQNVTLKGENYARKLEMPEDCPIFRDECYLMIDYLPEFEDMVFLGMPFLETVMGVWNWDEQTISCEFFLY
jgi:saccharopepsin